MWRSKLTMGAIGFIMGGAVFSFVLPNSEHDLSINFIISQECSIDDYNEKLTITGE